MNKKEQVETKRKGTLKIPPDTSLADKIRRINLSITEAIGELVANSFDARRENQKVIKIEVRLSGPGKGSTLEIIDDGKGMTLEELNDALILGKSSKGPNHKGIYGLGLKTASGIIGDTLTIETTISEKGPILRAVYDIESIKQGDTWEVPYEEVGRDKSRYFKSKVGPGTFIAISNLARSTIQFEPIRAFLSLSFKQHLEANDEIWVAGIKITPHSYDLYPDTKKEVSIQVNDHQITGWFAIQKIQMPKSNFGMVEEYAYGVTIYRNKQLVQAFFKGFLPRAHPDYGNVIGELNIDFAQVNYTKKGVNFLNPIWPSLKKAVDEKIKKFCTASRSMYAYPKKGDELTKEKKKDAKIARMYEALGKKSPFEPIAGPPSEGGGMRPIREETETVSGDISKPIKLIGSNKIVIAEREIKFEFIYQNDEESPWQWHDSELRDDGMMMILLNKSFNLLKSAQTPEEKKIFCVLALAEEIQDFLIQQGMPRDQSQKDVFEWINENYNKISTHLD